MNTSIWVAMYLYMHTWGPLVYMHIRVDPMSGLLSIEYDYRPI